MGIGTGEIIATNKYNGVDIVRMDNSAYAFKCFAKDRRLYWVQHLQFQNGFQGGDGANGIHNEELLVVLIDRISLLDEKLPCEENKLALDSLKVALEILNKRSADREARDVLGTAAA
jgi:hypothetical protein